MPGHIRRLASMRPWLADLRGPSPAPPCALLGLLPYRLGGHRPTAGFFRLVDLQPLVGSRALTRATPHADHPTHRWPYDSTG